VQIVHLSLTNFRNYTELALDLPPHISVFSGANAQGKTNLLESICFLATTRFSRAIAEREIIHWDAMNEPMPFARLSASMSKSERNFQIDIGIRPRGTNGSKHGKVPTFMQKQIRLNGIPQRAVDLVGQLKVVMFSPRDIDLICGEPALRRRYLDITNSQIDSHYLRALQRYNRVLARRNHLLRQIATHQATSDELTFWDGELISSGSYIIHCRQQTLTALNTLANPINEQISGGQEGIDIRYRRTVAPDGSGIGQLDDLTQAFRDALQNSYPKDVARGATSIGPHRDDMEFRVNGIDMGPYGSRGQQRTIALALKLAEVEFMLSKTGETPVLLLDDVLSELDAERRQHLLETAASCQQVLITATDIDRFPADFLAQAEHFTVKNGQVEPAHKSTWR